MGGVYSADGQIVVREGRGHHGYNITSPKHHNHHHHHVHQQHHHHHSGSHSKHSNDKRSQKHHNDGRWEPEEKRCDHHWRGDSRQTRRQELIPRARLRQRSPDYSKWEDPVRPLRHTVSFCGKLGSQYSQNQPTRQTGNRRNETSRVGERGFCTLKRDSRRSAMERSDESNESGYDGGSQENILSEPHYETVGKKKEQPKRRTSNDKIQKEENQEESKEKKMGNGHAKFCDSSDQNQQKTHIMEDKECTFEGNKLTIHAVIETVRRDHVEEHEIRSETIESESIYQQTDSENNYQKMDGENIYQKMENENIYEKIADPKEPKHNLEDDHHETSSVHSVENNKEVVYSHISINKTIKKSEYIEEKQEEKKMVQELVKVAEEIGAPPKIPTPPPQPRKQESKDDITYLEEEYSYEPELKKSSSKLVMRTRSLLNLEEENTKSDRGYVRPPAIRMKITTGPDGTFVIDGRKASSELNLSDESGNGSPKNKRTSISGEDLKKRKEEIFKPKEKPPQNANKYFEEINQNKPRTTKEEAIHNLKKYLKDNNIGLKELLTNNNVVIIDTYREKKMPEDLSEYNHKSVRDCRITGTTAKGEVRESHTLPRASRVHQPVVQRHYFYNLFKQKKSPPDEELPDPDKVRTTRQMFQKTKEKVISAAGIMLPIAAKVGNPKKEARPTPEVRLINQGEGSPRRWTDSGSLSSGVSSDMSLLDNMSDKCYSSEEEEEEQPSPIIETHPISPEVLKKIRECGTTITYYGGRVISHSHGPGNPMTMTIMDEIRQGREGGRGKFRLVKSNSCGSRLELAGTDDQHYYHEMSRGRFYEDMYGGRPSLSEEMKNNLRPVEEERRDDHTKSEKSYRKDDNQINGHDISKWGKQNNSQRCEKNEDKPSWRALIESRKQKRAMEHNRRPCPDMVFEEFQVLES